MSLQQTPCSTSSACKHAAAKPSRRRCISAQAASKEVTLLDYGAGNVRSVRNAIKKLGYSIKDVSTAAADLPTRVASIPLSAAAAPAW